MKHTFRSILIGVTISAITLSHTESSRIHPAQLQTNPSNPILKQGTPYTFRYEVPESGFSEQIQAPSTLWVLIFENQSDSAETIEMHEKNGAWEVAYTLTDTSVKTITFAFMAENAEALLPENLIDDNDGAFWNLLVHDATGTPVRGAHQTLALLYAGFGGRQEEDLDRATEEIAKELSLYPDNYEARILRYTLLLRKDEYSEAARWKIEREVDALLDKHPQDRTALNFATKAYQMIDKKDKAQKIEEKLIRQDPKGDKAAMKVFEKITKLENAKVRAERLEEFLAEKRKSFSNLIKTKRFPLTGIKNRR